MMRSDANIRRGTGKMSDANAWRGAT